MGLSFWAEMTKSPARTFKVLLHDMPPLKVLKVVPVNGSQTQQFHNCPEHSLVITTSILKIKFDGTRVVEYLVVCKAKPVTGGI